MHYCCPDLYRFYLARCLSYLEYITVDWNIINYGIYTTYFNVHKKEGSFMLLFRITGASSAIAEDN